jgi:hypothetical protein
VAPAVDRLGLGRAFDAVITAEDNASPELETSYLAASHQLGRPPLRCVVVGDSNRSVEAAHELGMKSVVIAGSQPAWQFGSADLVVRGLGQLSFVNLKSLFAEEDLVEPSVPWEEVRASKKAADGGNADGWAGGGGGGGGGSSSGRWETVSIAGAGLGAASGSSMSAGSIAAWETEGDEEEGEKGTARGGGFSWSGLGDRGLRGGAKVGAGDVSMGSEEDEEDEVILPPAGAAFWDLQR